MRSFWILCSVLLWCCIGSAKAVTVTDAEGTFTMDHTPTRIVALELSFVDDLAAIGVKPVGVADDNAPERVLPEVRRIAGQWESVGLRSQPSLERIAALKPDLIIADVSRHSGVAAQLKAIAPTLMLASRRATYAENLHAAALIGEVVGQSSAMTERLTEHRQRMADFARQLPAGKQMQFLVARPDTLFIHAPDSFVAGVLTSLGLSVPTLTRSDELASRQISLEQLLAINPQALLIGSYDQGKVLNAWQNKPLWQVLNAVREKQVYSVDANIWVRCLGILAAEHMGRDLVRLLGQ
ncbi:Fe(3+) dicitrate ABC transporter substrate-binding protein [Pokkaliibacter sp. CJK22405]|uniref:Fe(3+) dicitrate ABC transporter substrate-binding protein n=1 Tax=Pokkaliibacter sp. CJK22405 TaxID=3384615 RepID=UPI003984A14E